MLLVDTVKGKIYQDEELKEMYTTNAALRRMAGQQSGGTQRLENSEYACRRVLAGKERKQLQKAFGYTYEEYPIPFGTWH